MLRFAEEIMLLLLDDENGSFARVPDRLVRYALGGGVLMELALEDRIDTDLDKLVLVDNTPLQDSLIDPTLSDIVAATETHDTRYWLERTAARADEIREGALQPAGARRAFSLARKGASCGYFARGAIRPSTARPRKRSSCASWKCCSAIRSPTPATWSSSA